MIHTDGENPVQMRRAYKFLLRPTARQAAALAACLEDHRQLYNAALEERRDAWRIRGVSVSNYLQATQLPEIRVADPGWLSGWLQQQGTGDIQNPLGPGLTPGRARGPAHGIVHAPII